MAGRWWLLAGLVALSACATPAAPPQPGEAAAAPPASINGRYRGIARLVRATISGCPRSFGQRLVVVDANALSLNYRGARASFALVATVAGDGTIHGSDGRGTIEGRISGNHMDLLVSSDYCDVRYALDRIGGS